MLVDLESSVIGIIGLGYVGLPLAVEFGKHLETVGYDINQGRVKELDNGVDSTLEVTTEELQQAAKLTFSADAAQLKHCNIYIVTVPTPIDSSCQPDLRPLIGASRLIGDLLGRGDIVIYESTVYPGATEEVCIPIIEEKSGLVFNQDFYAGYSPERINPGDKEHRVVNIVKVTSGSTPEASDVIDALYRKIVTVGTHKASSIKVAEAAKVIENTQRDINIALVNELALIFDMLAIDTQEVLEAAGSKWNFLPFRPGLVGGHCISVDPYYLTHKAQQIGYHPEVILAGRRINDKMGSHVSSTVIKMMTRRKIQVVDSNILILGMTFKENCPDVRNTRVVDIIDELKAFHAQVDVYDPWVNKADALAAYGIEVIDEPLAGKYDAIIIAVNHHEFVTMGADNIRKYGRPSHVLFDVKYCFDKQDTDGRL